MDNKIKTPDGELKPRLEALEEWYKLSDPLERLGFMVHGFDPGISFRSQSAKNHLSVFTISVDDLKIINKAITR